MRMDITSWRRTRAEFGYLAHFDAWLGCGITVRDIIVNRPEALPSTVHLVLPRLARHSRKSVSLSLEIREKIGKRAADPLNAATGLDLVYAREDWSADDVPEDTGLRRILGAGEAEALEIAGF